MGEQHCELNPLEVVEQELGLEFLQGQFIPRQAMMA